MMTYGSCGSILLVASMRPHCKQGHAVPVYNSSKAAVIQSPVVWRWSGEVCKCGIRVNCLCPGMSLLLGGAGIQRVARVQRGLGIRKHAWAIGATGGVPRCGPISPQLGQQLYDRQLLVIDGGHTAW